MNAPSHPDPFELLQRWLATQPSLREVAKTLGCHASYLSLLTKRRRSPGLDFAFALERATAAWSEGPIRAEWWSSDQPATGTDG